ncbi:MAG: HlyD family secretion protein [Candidatus Promineifilaceae bacterium]
MNEKVKIIIGVTGIIVVAIAIGWIYYALNPSAWDSFIADMSGESTSSVTASSSAPRPFINPVRTSGTLTASGNIEAEEVLVAAELGGRITELATNEGDDVQAGDLLLQIDRRALLAQQESAKANVAQAQGALAAAQAQLDAARSGATAEEIAAAEAAVVAAEGSLAAAQAAVTQAEVNADSARTIKASESAVAAAEATLAQAQSAVDLANANLAAANAQLEGTLAGARPEEIAHYQYLVNQAQSEFLLAENIHFVDYIDKDIGGWPEERARYQRESARNARDAIQAQLDLLKAGASESELATAYAGVAAAQAQVNMAKAGVSAAEAALAEAQASPETTQDSVAAAEAGITAAEAQVKVAEGQLAQAHAQLDRLRAGATPEEIAALEAQVAQAQAAVQSAEALLSALDIQLEQSIVEAPVSGVVLQRLLQVGELASPGAPLFTLANLDEVTLTVYVPEAELGRVALGQEAEVLVDAYDQSFPGEVVHIASQAEFTPKNVQTQEERVHMVFAVKIRLDNPEHLLKPGMPADAVFAADQVS